MNSVRSGIEVTPISWWRQASKAALSVIAVVALSISINQAPASAHAGEDDETDAEHAAADLADTSVEEIEKQTAEAANQIQAQTGVRPGTANSSIDAQNSDESRAAAVDPARGGKWSPVVKTYVVPVFQAVLPNGKVLMWDSVGNGAAETYPNHTFTRAMVWDPSDDSYDKADVQGYNIFCAGYTQLANGNVLVAGGNKNKGLDGIVQTHIFDWKKQTWSRGPNMAAGRWYPSVTSLANGEATIIGGGPKVAEVYQTNGKLRKLTDFTNYNARIYPFVISRPDSRIQLLGPEKAMFTVATGGNGAITARGTRDNINRQYGSFATYGLGKTLVAGGGSITESGKKKVPTKTAVVVNTNGGATVGRTSNMSVGRRQFNLTVLADGSALATGGASSAATSGLVDLKKAVLAAERWDPATGKWTVLSSANRVRQYHSTASLLPDGRVLTGGGGICGVCTKVGYLEKNVEYFTPPYLFKKDGSGQLAARPAISKVGANVAFNTGFTISSPQAQSIKKVGLVRLGAPTHGDDQSQRYVPLTFTRVAGTIAAKGPANGGIAPPGYYMLFITNADGVPSVAKIVKVAKGKAAVATAVKGINNRCVDLPQANIAKGTDLRIYTCNSSPAQMISAGANQSLRVLGKCMDLDHNRQKSGTKVQIWNCNGTVSQKWVRRADGTVRFAAKPSLCLSVVGRSTKNRAGLEVRTCANQGTQKWSWT